MIPTLKIHHGIINVFSLYCMGNTKEVLYNLVGDYMHSFVLHAPAKQLEKNANKTKET